MNMSISKTIGTRAASAAGLAILLLGAAAAHASVTTDDDARTKVVHYGDLNVNTDDGAQRLYLRLNRAAEHVCGDDRDVFDERFIYYACEQAAIERAVDHVALPKLTAQYDRRFGDRAASGAARVSRAAPSTPAIVLVG